MYPDVPGRTQIFRCRQYVKDLTTPAKDLVTAPSTASNEVRMKILLLLVGAQPLRVRPERDTGMTVPAVSQHLKKAAGRWYASSPNRTG